MAKAAETEELLAGFEKHFAETKVQIEKLEKVIQQLGKLARGKTCPALHGTARERKSFVTIVYETIDL